MPKKKGFAISNKSSFKTKSCIFHSKDNKERSWLTNKKFKKF